MKRVYLPTAIVLTAVLSACGESPLPPEAPGEHSPAEARVGAEMEGGPYTFSPAVFDIDAAPDGSLLVARSGPGDPTVLEIRKGEIAEVVDIPTIPGSPINGVETIGRGSFFATSGGLDQADGAGVWHVSHGRARLVGDVDAFETAHDPDALEGPRWKDPLCEEDPSQGFTAGPQSNPYHVQRTSGNSVYLADAAGNTLLSARTDGEVDWVAVFTPPVDDNGDWRVLGTALGHPDVDCYVQPVPTSVAIGPDEATYAGELTGAPAVPGWSRVWRIAPGARHVVCPSGDCEVVIDGLTSVIDLEFGPDGWLYVVEYEANGWLAALLGTPTVGGTVQRCDVQTGVCTVVEDGLLLPGAITFDKRGELWLLEGNIVSPTVRTIEY